MAILEYKKIPLNRNEVPCEKEIAVRGEPFLFRFDYNSYGDFYTCHIKTVDGKILYAGKLSYMTGLIDAVVPELPPDLQIIPLDEADVRNGTVTHERLGKENLDRIDIAMFNG